MITTINNFDEIIIVPFSLVVLDIDETILKFEDINSKWWKSKFNRYYRETQSSDLADILSHQDWIKVVSNMQPDLVDNNFHNFLEKTKNNNCETILLTARTPNLRDMTNIHLDNVNLQFDKIFFNSDKGEELYNIVQNNYSNITDIIVADDRLHNLHDIKSKFSETKFNLHLYNIIE